jgi:hypothetical protein
MSRLCQVSVLLATSFAFGSFASASTCPTESVPQPLPVRGAPVAPLASELGFRDGLSLGSSPLGAASSEALALDVVLMRLRIEGCPPLDEYASYQPRTEFDNTPWRYNMAAGQKFTAAEFDAWMKSRGVRVATGKPSAASEAAAAAAVSAPAAAQVVEQ